MDIQINQDSIRKFNSRAIRQTKLQNKCEHIETCNYLTNGIVYNLEPRGFLIKLANHTNITDFTKEDRI